MRTIIYVDGFNLYFRLLVNRPAAKWLNVKALAEKLLDPANVVTGVKYYTARVSGRIDATAPARQQIYLDALGTVAEISIHLGSFLLSEKFASLVKPPEFRPRVTLAPPWPDVVKVIKVEEKGSDVNLASHLLLDAFQGNFDVAAVLSNDSDLVEPVRIVTQVLGRPGDLTACQFPDPVTRADGSTIAKPATWA
jgi:hypothetical protein